ncbi:hypothetical protein GC175_04545 [bacterium]|nr:hypothetical protein [bacterium]
MEAGIRLYLDENLSPRIAEQLRLRGIDAISVRELGYLGDSDENHLERATRLGRVLVTADTDFLRLAADGVHHTGIIFGLQAAHSTGDWVRKLELICFVYSTNEFKDHVEYL